MIHTHHQRSQERFVRAALELEYDEPCDKCGGPAHLEADSDGESVYTVAVCDGRCAKCPTCYRYGGEKSDSGCSHCDDEEP